MRRVSVIVGGVVAATLAMYGPARGESPRAITIQGRPVVLPPVTREYDRLMTVLQAGATRPVVPPITTAASAAQPGITSVPSLTPPPGPPPGTPLMERLDYFRSKEYRQWFEDLVKATAREHLSGASRPK